MKVRFSFSFKGRNLRFYLLLVSSLVAILSSIVFFIFDRTTIEGQISYTNHTVLTFLIMLLSGILGLVDCFSNLSFLSILSAVLYGVGVGRHLSDACYPYADLVQGVHFFCNSEELAKTLSIAYTIFLVLFVLCMIAAVVSSFLSPKKVKLEESKAQ